jgi:hypothetical protein
MEAQAQQTQKPREIDCPICYKPMKVNEAFKVAHCFPCDYSFCWADPVSIVMSQFRLAEALAREK